MCVYASLIGNINTVLPGNHFACSGNGVLRHAKAHSSHERNRTDHILITHSRYA